jgi:hypothetical protein
MTVTNISEHRQRLLDMLTAVSLNQVILHNGQWRQAVQDTHLSVAEVRVLGELHTLGMIEMRPVDMNAAVPALTPKGAAYFAPPPACGCEDPVCRIARTEDEVRIRAAEAEVDQVRTLLTELVTALQDSPVIATVPRLLLQRVQRYIEFPIQALRATSNQEVPR